MECSKKSKCKNYREKCNSCMSLADIYNHYPWYESVDVVEVIRCKDCKKWLKLEPSGTKCRVCADTTKIRLEYDFCSRGERRMPDA